MKTWFENMGRKMQVWMIGRYGMDEFSRTLLWIGVVCIVLSWFPHLSGFSTLALLILIYTYFRCFSKNIAKRSMERDWYIRHTSKISAKTNIYKRMWRERKTHRYFKCKSCKTYVRVPKGKGKIAIRCTKCGCEMIKRS